jgi:HEAT repeat protein
MRLESVKALGAIKDPSAITNLKMVLKDQSREVAYGAAMALASIGDRSVIPAIKEAHNNYSETDYCEFCRAVRILEFK